MAASSIAAWFPNSSGQGTAQQWSNSLILTSSVATAVLAYSYKGALANGFFNTVCFTTGKTTGQKYLTGNYAPQHEESHKTELEVEGSLPKALEGMYVRTGPNPFYAPTRGYHWFDGDGMLHGVRVADGKASYASHQVRTAKLKQEQAAGHALFPKFGDLFGLPGLAMLMADKLRRKLGGVDVSQGTGTANTALVYHANRLLALHEGDLPYAIRMACNGLLETMGRIKLDAEWKGPFTAHPKLDAETGELLFFGYNFDSKPYVHVGIQDRDGHVTRTWGVDIPYPTMMHDCAMTKDYFVVMHLPFVFDPERMVKQNTIPFVLDKAKPARIGLLRRDQPSADLAEVQWFELPGPGFMAFHVANAWQDSDKAGGCVRVFACQQDDVSLDLDNVDTSKELARLHEYVLDPATGKASVRCMTQARGDFPVVAPALVGRASRWAWLGEMDTAANMPVFTGIAKVDLMEVKAPVKDATTARISFPQGCYGGEAVFVPRDPKCTRTDNDDGYLVVYVFDSSTEKSSMCVYDAATMGSKPLAIVHINHRVPYGFHGTWVNQEQLKTQLCLA